MLRMTFGQCKTKKRITENISSFTLVFIQINLTDDQKNDGGLISVRNIFLLLHGKIDRGIQNQKNQEGHEYDENKSAIKKRFADDIIVESCIFLIT